MTSSAPRRRRRILAYGLAGLAALVLAAGLGHVFAPAALGQRKNVAVRPTSIEIAAVPLAGWRASDPEQRAFGPLRYRGGLVLTSPHPDFGGISSIRMEAGGARFLAVTDRGMWLRGRLIYNGTAPSGIAEAEIAPILGADGRPITARRWYDAEALALDGGTAYVALERVHRILRFDHGRHGLLARGRPIPVPAEFRNLPSNRGIEGLVAVPKGMPLSGTLIALSERFLDPDGNIRGFLIGGPTPGSFAVRRSDDFDITDAAVTPDGSLLILERSFSILRGVRMRLRRVALNEIRPGVAVEGEVLVRADMGYHIDNMEGLSVHRGADGETVVTVISDDNFSSFQRTLLLQFTLEQPLSRQP